LLEAVSALSWQLVGLWIRGIELTSCAESLEIIQQQSWVW